MRFKGNKSVRDRNLHPYSGATLLEMVFSILLGSVVLLAMIGVSRTQFTTMKMFDERMDLQDLRYLLNTRLKKSSVCEGNLMPGGTGLTVSNPVSSTNISLPAIYYNDSSGPAIIVSGQKVLGRRGIIVSGIHLTGLSSVGSNEYSGKIVVDFNQSSVTRNVASISIPLVVHVTGGRIDSCNEITSVTSIKGRVIYASPDYGHYQDHGTSWHFIDLNALTPGYTKILFHAFCRSWDDGGNEYSTIDLSFLDSSYSNTGLLSMQLCYQNAVGDDEEYSRANNDFRSIMLPKPGGVVRYIRIGVTRNTTSAGAYFNYQTIE